MPLGISQSRRALIQNEAVALLMLELAVVVVCSVEVAAATRLVATSE